MMGASSFSIFIFFMEDKDRLKKKGRRHKNCFQSERHEMYEEKNVCDLIVHTMQISISSAWTDTGFFSEREKRALYSL